MKNQQPLESDWKAFRKLVPKCRERYLQEVNKRIANILTSGDEGDSSEAFWNAHEEIVKEKEILRACLDGHRRSTLVMSAGLMHRHGLLIDEDLELFSDEFASRIETLSEL